MDGEVEEIDFGIRRTKLLENLSMLKEEYLEHLRLDYAFFFLMRVGTRCRSCFDDFLEEYRFV